MVSAGDEASATPLDQPGSSWAGDVVVVSGGSGRELPPAYLRMRLCLLLCPCAGVDQGQNGRRDQPVALSNVHERPARNDGGGDGSGREGALQKSRAVVILVILHPLTAKDIP